MTLHDGLLLLGAVVVLYLYDSALLLYHNEIVLVRGGSGCRVSGGSAFELRGRHVYLPNPFCPHQPVFRLNWPMHGEFTGSVAPVQSRRLLVALAAISPWMLCLLALFAVALPYALFMARSAEALLGWIASVYVTIVLALVKVYRHRKALGLSSRDIMAIVLDAMLCAPFALNMLRKIGLRQRFHGDLRVLAQTRFSPRAAEELTQVLRKRIQTSLHFIEPEAPAFQALNTYLVSIEGLRK